MGENVKRSKEKGEKMKSSFKFGGDCLLVLRGWTPLVANF